MTLKKLLGWVLIATPFVVGTALIFYGAYKDGMLTRLLLGLGSLGVPVLLIVLGIRLVE